MTQFADHTMNRSISTETIGDSFSKAFDNLICKANLSKTDMFQKSQIDIMSIWECKDTHNKFRFYVVNGIEAITERLFNDLYQSIWHLINIINKYITYDKAY